MKKAQVEIGGIYRVRISGNFVFCRIDHANSTKGWQATNLMTKRAVSIRTAAKLRWRAYKCDQCGKLNACHKLREYHVCVECVADGRIPELQPVTQ